MQGSREGEDGGEPRAARAGLDGRLGIHLHVTLDVGRWAAPSHAVTVAVDVSGHTDV